MIENYDKYREKQVKLHAKILKDSKDNNRLRKGYEIIGVLKGNDVLLESEEEAQMLFDFNMFEKINDNKSAVEFYLENNKAENEIEEDLLSGMTHTHTSLYKVESINRDENTLCLEDILNGGEKIIVSDKDLSEDGDANIIIFARILKLKNFNITSGMVMIFDGNHKDYLLRRSKKNSKKYNIEDEDIKRFISYFHLYKSDGKKKKA